MKNKFKISKGYTLVEILVVISIIGFMAAAAVYAVNIARVKGRDARRMADLEVLRKAIELYYDDNKSYPIIDGGARSSATSGALYTRWVTLGNLLKPYLDKLPVDPINNGNPFWTGGYAYYFYSSASTPNQYDLITQLEDGSNPNVCKYKCQKYYAVSIPWCEPTYCAGGWGGSNNIYANH